MYCTVLYLGPILALMAAILSRKSAASLAAHPAAATIKHVACCVLHADKVQLIDRKTTSNCSLTHDTVCDTIEKLHITWSEQTLDRDK